MNVILLKTLKGKGELGDQIRVKEGYARNYLFPYKYALPATPENIRHFKSLKNKELKALSEKKVGIEAIAKKIDGKTIDVSQKTSKGKLYGSYTPNHLIENLKESFGVDVDRQTIQMPDHVKEVGKLHVTLTLHPEVRCSVTVNITSEEEISEPTVEDVLSESDKCLESETDTPTNTKEETTDTSEEESPITEAVNEPANA